MILYFVGDKAGFRTDVIVGVLAFNLPAIVCFSETSPACDLLSVVRHRPAPATSIAVQFLH